MKCLKCGHILPDDSAFCQYCGTNLEQRPEESNERPIGASAEETGAAEALAGILATQIVEGRKAVAANQGLVDQHVYDPEYGFVPQKPIYASGVDGEKQYLGSLRTVAGVPVTWNRRGSMGADGIHGMIDIYDVYLPSGDLYRTLYLNMYSPTNSKHPPAGFYIASQSNSNSMLTTSESTKKPGKTRSTTNTGKTSAGEKTLKVLSWILVVLATSALVIALYQIYGLRNQNEEQLAQINTLQEKISDLETTINKQNNTINSQKKTIANLKPKADNYDDICLSLKYGNIGFAAYNFKSDESVIVVRKNEKDRKFTLTANWTSYGYVDVSYSSYAATVSFDKDSWSTSTKMTVNPHSVGATVVTFSNTVNNDTFKILIIVTD